MKRIVLIGLIIGIVFGNFSVFAAQREPNPDTSDWFVYEYPQAADIAGTPLDVSDLLDAPAGKHGFLVGSEDERFMFEDGEKIRFWGINLQGDTTYMNYESSEEMAARLAQSGFNIARLHLIDSGIEDGIWGRKSSGGRVIRKEAMNKLCYLISELKKRGIYIMLDLMTSMPPNADLECADLENQVNGLKKFGYFDDTIKQIQKEYANLLLSYYNPYTGLRLRDDPAIALIDIKNEDIISGTNCIGSDYYEEQLQTKFNTWLLEKYDSREDLKTAWEKTLIKGEVAKNHISDTDYSITEPALTDNENPADGTVKLYEHRFSNEGNLPFFRMSDKTEFLCKIQEEYYAEMTKYLRDIGVRCRITGVTCFSENGRARPIFYSNRNTDYIDTHHYTTGISDIFYNDGTTRSDAPNSMLSDTWASIIGQIGMRSVYGMPHTVSEWNDIAPNKYRSESMLMVSAYSSLQGVHPFCFSWCSIGKGLIQRNTDNYVKTCFGFSDTPEQMAAMPAAARIFLRKDASEAESGYYPMRHRGAEPFSLDLYFNTNTNKWMARLGLIGKTGMIYDDVKKPEGVNDRRILWAERIAERDSIPYVSVTGELSADLKNCIFKMNTPKTQAVSGKIENCSIELDDVIFKVDNPFATVILNAVENKPIYQSGRLLVTVTGDTRNTGMVLSDDEKTIIAAGTAPVIVEPITGEITIKTDNPISVYALKSNGQRSAAKNVARTAEGYKFSMDKQDKAMYYEIVTQNTADTAENPHISFGTEEMPDLFNDVTNNNPYKKAIEDVALFINLQDKNFLPKEQITKGDFVRYLTEGLRLPVWYDRENSMFYDLATNAPEYAGISIAHNMGAIEGKYRFGRYYIYPNNKITRGDAMDIAAKILKRTPRNENPEPGFSMQIYSDYSKYKSDARFENFRYIMGLGYMEPSGGKIAPETSLTREEAMDMIEKILWK